MVEWSLSVRVRIRHNRHPWQQIIDDFYTKAASALRLSIYRCASLRSILLFLLALEFSEMNDSLCYTRCHDFPFSAHPSTRVFYRTLQNNPHTSSSARVDGQNSPPSRQYLYTLIISPLWRRGQTLHYHYSDGSYHLVISSRRSTHTPRPSTTTWSLLQYLSTLVMKLRAVQTSGSSCLVDSEPAVL